MGDKKEESKIHEKGPSGKYRRSSKKAKDKRIKPEGGGGDPPEGMEGYFMALLGVGDGTAACNKVGLQALLPTKTG